jgi:hypothetical protein
MTRILILLLLFGQLSFGQTLITGKIISTESFISDSIDNSPNNAFNKKIRLDQIENSYANVDIRLYQLNSLSNTTTLRRLFLVDTIWNAVEYDEWNKPVKIKKYKLIAVNSFDSIFIKLLSNKVLTLPNQTEIKSKMQGEIEVTAEGDTLANVIQVVDGESYTLEIKIADKYRIFSFNNPDIYAKFYANVSEFKDYASIVETMYKCLKKK